MPSMFGGVQMGSDYAPHLYDEAGNFVGTRKENKMTKKFVIVIDTQFDFMMPQGKLYVTGAEHTIVPGIKYLQSLTPEDTAGVLFTYDTHDANDYYETPESKQFPIHCERNTTGWQNVFNSELVDAAIPTIDLVKNVFNMWEQSEIVLWAPIMLRNAFNIDADAIGRDGFFQHLKDSGVDTVVVMGVAADFCVKWAVDGLVARGFNVEIPQALTAGIVRDIQTVVAEDFPAQVTIV